MSPSLADLGPQKAKNNKNNKSLTLNPQELAIFVVCPLLLAHLGPQKAKDNKNKKSLTLNPRYFCCLSPSPCPVGPQKAKDNKNNKSLTLNPQGFAIFVVCPLLLAHLGPQKAKDDKTNKNIKEFLLSVPFSLDNKNNPY